MSTRQTLVGVEVGRHGHAQPGPGDQAVVAGVHQQGPAALLQTDSLEYPHLKQNKVVLSTEKEKEMGNFSTDNQSEMCHLFFCSFFGQAYFWPIYMCAS